MVILSPVVPPVADIVGVVSELRLSEDELPRSEPAVKSGVPGALGDAVSIVNDNAAPVVEALPAASVSLVVTDQVPSVRVGRSQDVATPIT